MARGPWGVSKGGGDGGVIDPIFTKTLCLALWGLRSCIEYGNMLGGNQQLEEVSPEKIKTVKEAL